MFERNGYGINNYFSMKITLYDFNNLYYSSFYIAGFLKSSEECGITFKMSHVVPEILKKSEVKERKEILFSILLFKVETKADIYYFIIDTRDGNNLGSYHLQLLERCKYYFKVNYKDILTTNNHKSGVINDAITLIEGGFKTLSKDLNCSGQNSSFVDSLSNEATKKEICDNLYNSWTKKVIPIHPFFPIKPKSNKYLLPRILPSAAANWSFTDVLKRFKAMGNILTFEKIRSMRELPKKYDVFFIMTYYNKISHSTDIELRYRIMRGLQMHKKLNIKVGFISKEKLPDHMADLKLSTMPFEEYLRNLSQSKVGIYVRGLHECHSFKMTEQLALGLPVVGQKIINNRNELMKLPHFNEQYCYETADEIVDGIIRLLQDSEKMKKLSTSNHDTFDRCFTPPAICRNIIEKIF